MKIDDVPSWAHPTPGGVSPDHVTRRFAHPFVHEAVFVPVRSATPGATTASGADSFTGCDFHPGHLPPAAPHELLAVLDITLAHGGERRDSVCGRCLGEALHVADRHGRVVVWIVQPDAVLPAPLPPGGHARWPHTVVPPPAYTPDQHTGATS